MDLNSLKQKALELKNKSIDFANKTIDKTSKKICESSLVLKTEQELTDFILKSENKTFVNDLGENKVFIKRCIVIVGDSNSPFFRELILSLPILMAKSFSQNISIKMIDNSKGKLDLSDYHLLEIPCIIVFENKAIYKKINGEDGIKKIVKALSLDINKAIDEN